MIVNSVQSIIPHDLNMKTTVALFPLSSNICIASVATSILETNKERCQIYKLISVEKNQHDLSLTQSVESLLQTLALRLTEEKDSAKALVKT